MILKAVWISYDLGIKGDYEGLYYWLDLHKARECVGNLAFLKFKTEDSDLDLIANLEKSIQEAVEINKRSRIYIIFYGKQKRMRGRYLFGNRMASPWLGYAPSESTDESESDG